VTSTTDPLTSGSANINWETSDDSVPGIIGLIAGVVFVVFLIVLVFIILRRRRTNLNNEDEASNSVSLETHYQQITMTGSNQSMEQSQIEVATPEKPTALATKSWDETA
jgi:heme/copper-type cytochrome/quinol oxidase subunit 2